MKTETKNKQDEDQNGSAVRDCLTRLVSRWRNRKKTWIVDYGYDWTVGHTPKGRIFQTVKYRQKITATCRAEAFNHAERITAAATPEDHEGNFTIRPVNMWEILFG